MADVPHLSQGSENSQDMEMETCQPEDAAVSSPTVSLPAGPSPATTPSPFPRKAFRTLPLRA